MSETSKAPEESGRVTLEGEGWRYPNEVMERAEKLEGEVVATRNQTTAVVRAAEGKQVLFAYSEHYASYVVFKPTGKL